MEPAKTKFVTYRNSVEEINRAVREDARAFVQKAEEDYHRNIEEIAGSIAGESPMCKLVMLAGPSSSGKTTTAHMLMNELRRKGVGCVSISLDDFYLGENCAPLLPDGRPDYECLEALNVEAIRKCLSGLVQNNRCEMPVFDFEQHVPYRRRRQVILHDREVAVVEGIHALNPELIRTLPELRVRRIYISVKQGILDCGNEILGPNDIRLVRRIVRDYRFRKTDPDATLNMWPNVMRGERKYIKPFRRDADTTVNSFHDYELCVLKNQALALLHTVPENSLNRERADRLADALACLVPVDDALVPKTSMIREFIGGAA
ncbi:MAG: nucleoside kinase [Oscillospiraceae bacterium]|jgi:uridine kinase|nr:nucleoside kinase [Oscillospiraceae bacterium]